jgi:hypothetical protein
MEDKMRANGRFSDGFPAIESLAQDAIRLSIGELRQRDRLTIALRIALRDGADINDLSAASGLPVAEIRARVNRPLNVLSETDLLAGVA